LLARTISLAAISCAAIFFAAKLTIEGCKVARVRPGGLVMAAKSRSKAKRPEKSAQSEKPEGLERLVKPEKPAVFLRLAYSAPRLDQTLGEEIRRFTLPATKALPFVKVGVGDQPLVRPQSFWNVESTGKRENDVRLGRQYARLAIAAMKADRDSDLIALVIQDIIKDAVERIGKSGRGRNSPAALGFLAEISEVIAAAR
jgi:hypothetical protein